MLFRHWTEKFELYPYRIYQSINQYTEEAVVNVAVVNVVWRHVLKMISLIKKTLDLQKSMGAVCHEWECGPLFPLIAPLLNMITAWRKWSNQTVALTFAAVVKVSFVVFDRVDVVRICPVRSTPPNLPGFVFRDRRILRCELYEIFLRTLSICQHSTVQKQNN